MNTTAIAFYERLGYRKIAHLASYYGRALHAWKMTKALEASGPLTLELALPREDFGIEETTT